MQGSNQVTLSLMTKLGEEMKALVLDKVYFGGY